MKHILLFFSLFLGFSMNIQAQAPQAFQYQAIARASNNLPIISQAIGVKISIISGSPTGAILYVETHAPSTNQFGLFTLEIGQGTVANGTFNTIDWGANGHYLKVEMDEAGGSAYQDMGTVQLLSVPYALHAASVDNADDADADPNNELQTLSISGNSLSISNGNTLTLPSGGSGSTQLLSKTGNSITLSNGGGTVNLNDDNASNELQNLSLTGSTLSISNGNSVTIPNGGSLDNAYDFGGAGAGRIITADAGEVTITSNVANGIALRVDNTSTGVGLVSNTTNPSNAFSPIQANTNSSSNTVAGIIGNSTGTAWGVAGQSAANSTSEAAVYGSNLRTVGGHGVYGVGFNGVVGQTAQSTGIAVYGENLDNVAPFGNGVGVGGIGYYGVLGEDRYFGGQAGAYGVYSNGNLGATGTKTFRIDHPQDPENKFLRHFSIESNEVLNVYRGTTTFDANGNAIVELPDYFNSINRNVSYQLTPVGAYMPLFVKEKVNNNNQFIVSGGIAGKEVSWAVYAERNDLYMQQNPEQRSVEIEKRANEKGRYLIPALYNAGADKALFNHKPQATEQKTLKLMK
jgi:hypothetical protein